MVTIFERVAKVIAQVADVDEHGIKPNTHLEDDLNMDSLDKVELMMAIEEEFDGTEITDNEVQGLQTAEQIVRFIEEKLE